MLCPPTAEGMECSKFISARTTVQKKEIKDMKKELLTLHAHVTAMEIWHFDHKKSKTAQNGEYDRKQSLLLRKTNETLTEIASSLRKSSCASFQNDQLVGGGCKEQTTYSYQRVKMTISKPSSEREKRKEFNSK